MPLKSNQRFGFTLIEIMVAMSIFAIVALVSVSALLMANRVNQKAQALKVATDSLHFALSSLTFKLRQGKNFCRVSGGVGTLDPSLVDVTNLGSCAGATAGQAIVFLTPKWSTPSNPTQRVAYRLNGGRLEYWDQANGWRVITVDNLTISRLGFTVESSVVPRAFITVAGTASSTRESSSFQIQTLVSERL